MKQRNGFVSNSSSSSFIIGFNKNPIMKENLVEEMGDCTPQTWDGSIMTSDEVIDRIWSDITCADPAAMDHIMRELCHDIPYRVTGAPQWSDFSGPDQNQQYNRAKRLFEDNYVKNDSDMQDFLKQLEGKHVYILSYADEYGESDLEHGDIFRNVTYRAISHH